MYVVKHVINDDSKMLLVRLETSSVQFSLFFKVRIDRVCD